MVVIGKWLVIAAAPFEYQYPQHAEIMAIRKISDTAHYTLSAFIWIHFGLACSWEWEGEKAE